MAYRTLSTAALAATLALAACAHQTIWDSPTGDQAQFHRDNLECAQEARATVGDGFVMGPPLFVALATAAHNNNMQAAHDECMLGKNYTKHVGG